MTACAPARRSAGRGRGVHPRVAERLVPYLLTVALLAVVSRPLAGVVGFLWGLALAGELARGVAVPELRRRVVAREAARGLRRAVPHERRSLRGEQARELGALFASVAEGIRDPLRAAQGLVRQLGDDPGGAHHADYVRLALGELDRVEHAVAELLRIARQSAVRHGAPAPAAERAR